MSARSSNSARCRVYPKKYAVELLGLTGREGTERYCSELERCHQVRSGWRGADANACELELLGLCGSG